MLYGLSRSPVGLILQASGQDPVQAAALGFNVVKHKLASFIVSALFSGLAGALMVFYLGAASVGTFVDVTVGVQVIVGAVLGGRRTILGGALGAVFLIAAGEALRPLGDLATFIVSAIALVVVLVFPGGFSAWSAARGRRHERAPARGRESDQALRRPDRRRATSASPSRRRDSRPDRPERLRQIDGDEGDPRRRAADGGSVRIDGVEVAGWPPHKIARLGVGMVFQHSRPLHRQTVLENIVARRCCPIR